jgi:hypothetical protein
MASGWPPCLTVPCGFLSCRCMASMVASVVAVGVAQMLGALQGRAGRAATPNRWLVNAVGHCLMPLVVFPGWKTAVPLQIRCRNDAVRVCSYAVIEVG